MRWPFSNVMSQAPDLPGSALCKQWQEKTAGPQLRLIAAAITKEEAGLPLRGGAN